MKIDKESPECIDQLKIPEKILPLDLPYYDPFLIIKKTQGHMAEDDFWINIEG